MKTLILAKQESQPQQNIIDSFYFPIHIVTLDSGKGLHITLEYTPGSVFLRQYRRDTNSSEILCSLFANVCFIKVCVRTDFVDLREFDDLWHNN